MFSSEALGFFMFIIGAFCGVIGMIFYVCVITSMKLRIYIAFLEITLAFSWVYMIALVIEKVINGSKSVAYPVVIFFVIGVALFIIPLIPVVRKKDSPKSSKEN